MKASSATSAKAKTLPRPTVPSSAKLRHTPTSAEAFALTGPSDPPPPEFNAYRRDLADVALAGRVIASHYAEPIPREVSELTALRAAPSKEGMVVTHLQPGETFALLDDSLGWAWGYAGPERRVGYVHAMSLR